MKMKYGGEKRYWRCNQWWSRKCRARVYTVGDEVFPLKAEHTHTDVGTRKKREKRQKPVVEVGEGEQWKVKEEGAMAV